MQKDFMTITPDSGNGDGTISVTTGKNSGTTTRSNKITISGGGMTRTVNVSQKALSQPLPTKWMTVGNGLYVYINSSNNWGSTQFGFDIQFSNCDFRLAKAKINYSGTIPSGIFQYSLPGNWAFEQIEGQPNWEMDSGDNYLAAGGTVFNDIQWPYFATGEEGVEGNLNLIMECDLDIKIYVEYGNSFSLESYDMCVLKCDNISSQDPLAGNFNWDRDMDNIIYGLHGNSSNNWEGNNNTLIEYETLDQDDYYAVHLYGHFVNLVMIQTYLPQTRWNNLWNAYPTDANDVHPIWIMLKLNIS